MAKTCCEAEASRNINLMVRYALHDILQLHVCIGMHVSHEYVSFRHLIFIPVSVSIGPQQYCQDVWETYQRRICG
jgi:hypothetical protein